MSWSTRLATLGLLAAVLTGCGGDLNEPQTGAIEVTSVTTGNPTDPDGYGLAVDGQGSHALAPNATLSVADLSPGDHELTLAGVATNCALAGPNPRTVTVTGGTTARTTFALSCSALPTGSIEVGAVTTGASPDPDGYAASIDGGPDVAIPVGGSKTIEDLPVGNHTIRLSGIAPYCAVSGPNPVTASVAAGVTTRVSIAVICEDPASAGGILFESGRDATFPRSHLYRARADGSDVVDLTPASDGKDGRWSPDGARIAFTSYRDGNAEIYLMNADGGGVVRLTNDPADDTEPAWSPDGRRIAFVSTRTGGSNVYAMNADGTGVTALTGVAGGFEPSWSPDGASIAFARVVRLCQFDVCLADIFVVPAAGGAATNVTRGVAGQAYEPAWSRDGSRIAYSQDRQIYMIRPDGTEKTRISRDPAAQDVAPVWSPDGSQLAFTRYLDASEMFVMNADGTGVTDISIRAGSGSATDWR